MQNTASYALAQDHNDKLSAFRNEFLFPQHKGEDGIYFCGNSLGLQPIEAKSYLQQELDDWSKYGVEGHFEGKNKWMYYHHFFADNCAKLVGANPLEVVVMNNLSVNLHLMMMSFYKPTQGRYKILMEAGAFPSDQYIAESQAKLHGFNYEDAVIEMKPRDGEYHLRTEDIEAKIEELGDSLALVFFSGVQYYTGQVFDIPNITKKAHEVGAIAGWDLAHAAGNIELKLHDWNVDFAAWCTYKYLNSGPGSVGGVFIHEKHSLNPDTPRLSGWWGSKEDIRFKMLKGFIPEPGAQGWQMSNAPVFNMAIHMLSLDIFKRAGMDNLINKSKQLTDYLQYVIDDACHTNANLDFTIITPTGNARACQISILTGENGKAIYEHLKENGVISDWRNPNVIRLAAIPLYNSFTDIYKFGQLLKSFA